MTKPLVSICAPVYNGSPIIKRALKSCINQTYENIEIIVVDNSSSDDTRDIVQNFQAEDSRIKLHKNHQNIGSLQNFLKSFSLASGEFVQILCHDDWLSRNYVSEAVSIFNENKDVGAVFTRIVAFLEIKGNLFPQLEISFKTKKYHSEYFFKNRFVSRLGENDILATFKRKDVIAAIPLILKVMEDKVHSDIFYGGSSIDQLVASQILLRYPSFFFNNNSAYVKVGRSVSAGEKTKSKFSVIKILDAYRVCHEYLYKTELKRHLPRFRTALGSKLIVDSVFAFVKNSIFRGKESTPNLKEIQWFFRDYENTEKIMTTLAVPVLILKRSFSLALKLLSSVLKRKRSPIFASLLQEISGN